MSGALLSLALFAHVASTAPEAGAPERPRIAVLDLASTDAVGPDLPVALGAMLSAELSDMQAFDVITQDDVRKLIGFDRLKTALSCEGDESCLAEIGAALGVRWLLAGSLASVDDGLVLSLTLIDIEETSTHNRELARGSQAELLAQAPGLVRSLVRPLLEGKIGTLVLGGAPEGAIIEVDGRAIGRAPLPPLNLQQGRHRLEVQKEGFFAYERDFEIVAGKKQEIVVELRAAELEDEGFPFLLVGGGATVAAGAAIGLVGYGLSALFAYSYSLNLYYAPISTWMYVPGVGAAVFALLYTTTDDPYGVVDQGTGRILALIALVVQLAGLAVMATGAGLMVWGLFE